MSQQSDFPGGDSGLFAQPVQCGGRVGDEIALGSCSIATGGLANAALIVAQHRYAFPRQSIGQNKEDAMTLDGLVAVLWAGSGDHDDGRKGTFALWHGQGARQSNVTGRYAYVYCRVREGWLRCLR